MSCLPCRWSHRLAHSNGGAPTATCHEMERHLMPVKQRRGYALACIHLPVSYRTIRGGRTRYIKCYLGPILG